MGVAKFIVIIMSIMFVVSIPAYGFTVGWKTALSKRMKNYFFFMWALAGSTSVIIALTSIVIAWWFPVFAGTQWAAFISIAVGTVVSMGALQLLAPLYERLIVRTN